MVARAKSCGYFILVKTYFQIFKKYIFPQDAWKNINCKKNLMKLVLVMYKELLFMMEPFLFLRS